MAVDRSGTLWVGDSRQGHLARITRAGARNYLPLRYRRGRGARGRPLLLAPSGDRRAWVADGRVVSRFGATGVVRRVALPFAVGAVTEARLGALWVVGRGGRVARVSREGAVQVLRARAARGTRSIAVGPRRHLWAAVPGRARLLEVDERGRTLLHSLRSGDRTRSAVVRNLIAGGDGRLWVGTSSGLAVVPVAERVPRPAPGPLDGGTGCRFPPGAKVVAHGPSAAVARLVTAVRWEGAVAVSWWSCLAADHRVRLLFRGLADDLEPHLATLKLSGTHVAFTQARTNHYGEGPFDVCALDLARPGAEPCLTAGQFHYEDIGGPGDYAFQELVLGPDGTVAWIDRENASGVQVRRPGAAAAVTVATAPWGTLGNLTIDATTVSWTESGQPRSAPL